MKYFSSKTEGLFNFSDLRKPSIKVAYALMFVFMLFIAAICIFPVLWVFLSGFKEPSELYQIPPTFFPKSFELRKVKDVIGQINLSKYFINTFWIIIGSLIFDIIINGLAGYVLSRLKPLGTPILETLVFWSMLLPSVSMAPLYMTFVDMPLIHVNLTGTFLPLFLMAGCNAFNIMLFRNFFNGIPMDYVEAARIDGCSDAGIFRHIILPLSKPIVVVVAIFNIIASWSNFMWPYLILGDSGREPISVLLYSLSLGKLNINDSELMLIVMLSILPPIVIYALLSKHITGGLNMSGIKG